MNKREWMLQAALAGMRSGRLMEPLDISVQHLSGVYDAIVASTPEEPAWIEHRGEKPYPEGMVEYVTRDGWTDISDADDLDWTHDADLGDNVIIRWRPA